MASKSAKPEGCDSASQLAATHAAPQWRCFHCDEVFTDKAEAQEHFGEYLDDSPLCLIKGQDGGLAARVRELEAEVMEVCRQRNEYENDARLWHEAEADRRRRIGDRQWWQELDYREGEKIVLTEKLAATHAAPDVFPAVEDVLAKHCRGFMSQPTTRENIAELVDRMCETDKRHLHELQELKKSTAATHAAIRAMHDKLVVVWNRLPEEYRSSELLEVLDESRSPDGDGPLERAASERHAEVGTSAVGAAVQSVGPSSEAAQTEAGSEPADSQSTLVAAIRALPRWSIEFRGEVVRWKDLARLLGEEKQP